jgi:hypothetical protein
VSGTAPPPNRIELERKVLRALCAAANGATSTFDAKTLLSKYVWQDADNRVVFESLSGLSSRMAPAQLREQLPAQATRLGFPDVAWENYLASENGEVGDVCRLIEKLLEAE